MFFCYDHLSFRYEPFPIGCARPFMEDGVYRSFVENFPSLDHFASFKEMGKAGDKYLLSEKESPRAYESFLRSNPIWREFYTWIKSDEFVYGLLTALRERHIDLGYRRTGPVRRVTKRAKDRLRGKPTSGSHIPLRARFEFSALPADGGFVVPHTDAPTKIITIIISMVQEGEWDPAFGGGTDVNRPKDHTLSFNHMNRLARFEDMEVVDTFEFAPNQGVIFVKTFNSWHSVRPMLNKNSPAMRKTLTVTVEKLA